MHKQIRTVPAKSPADVHAFLAVLKQAGINIETLGGGDVERGGELAIGVRHEAHAAALKALKDAGYKPREVDVDYYTLEDKPGALDACVEKVARKNAQLGRAIRDISIGVPDANQKIQVQIYSE